MAALTWGYVKSWAYDNAVSDDAELVSTENGEPFRDLAYSDLDKTFELSLEEN